MEDLWESLFARTKKGEINVDIRNRVFEIEDSNFSTMQFYGLGETSGRMDLKDLG
jgi:hypothetical protein